MGRREGTVVAVGDSNLTTACWVTATVHEVEGGRKRKWEKRWEMSVR